MMVFWISDGGVKVVMVVRGSDGGGVVMVAWCSDDDGVVMVVDVVMVVV